MSTQPNPEPSIPAAGDRYVKRTEPDVGRIVTVTSVWTDEAGRTAVAYEWRDDKPGECGSACPLDVFERTYRPAAEQAPADSLAVIDGRDALAFVVIRPADDDPDRVTVEADARRMSKAAAAYTLRVVADQFDTAARAEGDEPIPHPDVEAQQPTDLAESPYDAARRFARRLAAVERLCSGRPGYHSITVKALLTAMSDADDQAEPVSPSAALRAAGNEAVPAFIRAMSDADEIEAQQPAPADSLAAADRAEVAMLRERLAEAVATVAQLEQKRVELERIVNAERADVAELTKQRDRIANDTAKALTPKDGSAYAAGLIEAARLAEQERVTNPLGEAEEHVNDCFNDFAAMLRRTATKAQQS
ncbi:hypothetical protein [Streptomyces similanensis]|uniref:Uncharacterized protein n=1 Tax=Streptomyces similanensis TaxID=1274988 RepID=A0ABP9KFW4_9ACTN